MSTSSAQNLVSSTILSYQEPRLLREMAASRSRTGKVQDKHLMMSESKKCSKNDEDMSQEHRVHLDEVLTGQMWESIKHRNK